MAAQEGESGPQLASARAALAARDADLADADRLVAEAVAAAHAAATYSIARMDEIRADLDAVATARAQESPAEAHELTRLLVAKQREITALVQDARAVAESNTIVLQHLSERYRTSSRG
jgi:hypothetical protein